VSSWGNRGERDRWGDQGVEVWIIFGLVCGKRAVYKFLVGKPEGKRPMGRPRRRWVDNIRTDLGEWPLYWVLVGNPIGKRTFGTPRHRWVENITMDLRGEVAV